MIAALLPCPFCGHEHPEFERMGDRRQSCIVICGNCGARHESGDEGSRNGSSWNQRSEPGQDGLRATLETALARIEDMLADDDGQAFKEARKFLESARQLSEQPGFVMVPVEVVKFLTGEGPLDGLWFGEHPFGLGGGKYWWRKHLFAASPTAPAQAEPVGNALQIADAIDPFTRKQAPDHLTMGVAASLLRALATPPSAATPEPSDAERYRLVRRGQHWSVIDGIGNVLRGDDLDAAIDAIRATKGGKL